MLSEWNSFICRGLTVLEGRIQCSLGIRCEEGEAQEVRQAGKNRKHFVLILEITSFHSLTPVSQLVTSDCPCHLNLPFLKFFLNTTFLVPEMQILLFFFFFLIYVFILFISFWLRWVFLAACVLSLVAASRGYSSLWCAGFSLWWLFLLRSSGSRHAGFSSCGLRALERWLSSCGAWASLLRGMWELPGPGLEPLSPALAGGFLTTAPPGKPTPFFSRHQ